MDGRLRGIGGLVIYYIETMFAERGVRFDLHGWMARLSKKEALRTMMQNDSSGKKQKEKMRLRF